MEQAVELLHRLPGRTVLCLGDVMLDRYIYGQASRISPEAPVPVVHVKKQVLIPGGVGNVVKNLEAIGVIPMAVSLVGDDTNADLIAGYLAGGGSVRLSLIRDQARPTIVKTRIIAGIQQVVRFDEEVTLPLSDESCDNMVAVIERLLGEAGAVAISDYGKGVVTPRMAQAVIKAASAKGTPVAIDPKGKDYEKYRGADLVKPNRKELAEASGCDVDTVEQCVEAGRLVMQRHGIKNLLVTLSEEGMILLHADRDNVSHLPTMAREVYDVTGAGDTVLACLAAAMSVGAELELGARLATLAAGVVVGKVGTAVATGDEIVKAARLEEDGA